MYISHSETFSTADLISDTLIISANLKQVYKQIISYEIHSMWQKLLKSHEKHL